MKRIAMVAVLTCVLSGVALAGEMPVGGAPQPLPSPTESIAATVVLTLIGLLGR